MFAHFESHFSKRLLLLEYTNEVSNFFLDTSKKSLDFVLFILNNLHEGTFNLKEPFQTEKNLIEGFYVTKEPPKNHFRTFSIYSVGMTTVMYFTPKKNKSFLYNKMTKSNYLKNFQHYYRFTFQ